MLSSYCATYHIRIYTLTYYQNVKVIREIRDEGQIIRPWAFLEIAVKCTLLRSAIKRHPGNYVAVRELNLQ